MNLNEIEELVKIVRDAKVSELTVAVGDATVKLRKPMTTAPKPRPQAKVATPKAQGEQAAPAEPGPNEVYITAPMVGIFHSIATTVTLESPIKARQAVGVIESMKLMNDIVSEHDGIIAEILIEDDMPVEYGQKLFKLRTA